MAATRCLLAGVTGTLLALTLFPCAGSAAPLEGGHRIEFRIPVPAANEQYLVCDAIKSLRVCYSFYVRVDLRGRFADTGTASVSGSIDGVPVAGNFPIAVSGSLKGEVKDGVTPSAKLELSIAARNVTVTAGGAERVAKLSAKLSGRVEQSDPDVYEPVSVALKGSRSLGIKGMRGSSGRVETSFWAQQTVALWSARLMVARDTATKLSGTATLTGWQGQLPALRLKGSAAKRTGIATLSLARAADFPGASFKLEKVDLSGQTPAFRLRFKLQGIRGVVSPISDSVRWSVLPAELQSEGQWDAPVDVTGRLPYAGSVGSPTQSYYRITGLTPDAPYTIELERVTNATAVTCGGGRTFGYNDQTAGARVECAANADPTGALEFSVGRASLNDFGGTFRLSLRAGGVLDEGTQAHPLDIIPPHTGVAVSMSHYRIGGLVPGATYTLSFEDVTGDANFEVKTDLGHRTPYVMSCYFNRPGESCAFIALETGDIFVRAQNTNPAGQLGDASAAAYYTLRLAEGGLPNEGTPSNRIAVAVGVPHAGSVHDPLGSHYRATGLVPGAPYTVTLRDFAAERRRLSVFGIGLGPPFDRASCDLFGNAGQTMLECVAQAGPTGTLVIRVDAQDNASGASYTLELEEGGLPNEGLFDQPVEVTGQLPRLSTVYNRSSFYVARGLGNGPVLLSVVPETPRRLAVSVVGPDPNEPPCFFYTDQTSTCVVTPTNGALEFAVDYQGGPQGPGVRFTVDVR